jgi:hypothetical protein
LSGLFRYERDGPTQQQAVEASKLILVNAGIGFMVDGKPNTDFARENLVWSPNDSHSTVYAQAVYDALEKLTDKSRDSVEAVLKAMGKKHAEGDYA